MGFWIGMILGIGAWTASAVAWAEPADYEQYAEERWDGSNNPATWSESYNYSFDQLPLEGSMTSHQPWSDTYWPTREAGIAARWNWPGQYGFSYRTFNEAQVRAMSRAAGQALARRKVRHLHGPL